MIIRLKDENNNAICETEVYLKNIDNKYFVEISSSVNIIFYSSKLLNMNKKLQRQFISDIYSLNELRGWYFEKFMHDKLIKNCHNEEEKKRLVISVIKEMYKDVAVKYSLTINED